MYAASAYYWAAQQQQQQQQQQQNYQRALSQLQVQKPIIPHQGHYPHYTQNYTTSTTSIAQPQKEETKELPINNSLTKMSDISRSNEVIREPLDDVRMLKVGVCA